MNPPQIIAQFRNVLATLQADDSLSDDARQQQIAGAYAMARQLIRSHPKLFPKGSTVPYMGELKSALAKSHPILGKGLE